MSDMNARTEIWYKPSRLAREADVTQRTIVRWIREGKLEGRKFGRVWRVSRTAWREFLDGLEQLPN